MCFFTQQNAPAKKLKKRFTAEIDNEENFLQANEIVGHSFPNIPIILDETPNIISTDYNWGLLPFWAKDESFRRNTLNARIETIDEKPSFKNINENRCLIIATGFYEWHWNDSKGKSKEKYIINSEEEEIFTFAGLYSKWKNPVTGQTLNTYTMVTTEANELMAYIHNHKKRMPVMLQKKDESLWLDKSIKISEFAFPYETKLKANNLTNKDYELF